MDCPQFDPQMDRERNDMRNVTDVKDALEVREKIPRAEYVVPALECQGMWNLATGGTLGITPLNLLPPSLRDEIKR